jgi:hypothetical protein
VAAVCGDNLSRFHFIGDALLAASFAPHRATSPVPSAALLAPNLAGEIGVVCDCVFFVMHSLPPCLAVELNTGG